MSAFVSRCIDWAVKHRSKMPRWGGRLMESAARNPDGFIGQISAKLLGGGGAVPATTVPETDVRLYIAPTNYSGQGYQWARAVEHSDPSSARRFGARNMAIELPGGYAFPADSLVPIATVNASAEWAEAEWNAVKQFTHVLVEAERPILGKRFGRSVDREVAALDEAGVSVAFMCHGTDIRNPDRHATLTPWSPYPEDPRTDELRADTQANFALLKRWQRPVFVSTPDLLADVPWAVWCPVVVDVAKFAASTPVLAAGLTPRVIHASSNPLQKGSDRIVPALAPLIAAAEIDYDLIMATPAAEMPAVFAASDIVLDQFRAGSYGVAACEAMAAGRVVVGHVLPAVRAHIEHELGVTLPIVEATTDTLHDVVAALIANPQRTREIAAAGPAFVAQVHSGAASARALRAHWIDA